jgi:hypothetical protein
MMRINVGSLRYSPSLSAWLIATEDHAKAEMLHYGDGDVIICPRPLLLAAADKRGSATADFTDCIRSDQ